MLGLWSEASRAIREIDHRPAPSSMAGYGVRPLLQCGPIPVFFLIPGALDGRATRKVRPAGPHTVLTISKKTAIPVPADSCFQHIDWCRLPPR